MKDCSWDHSATSRAEPADSWGRCELKFTNVQHDMHKMKSRNTQKEMFRILSKKAQRTQHHPFIICHAHAASVCYCWILVTEEGFASAKKEKDTRLRSPEPDTFPSLSVRFFLPSRVLSSGELPRQEHHHQHWIPLQRSFLNHKRSVCPAWVCKLAPESKVAQDNDLSDKHICGQFTVASRGIQTRSGLTDGDTELLGR